ncbi:MAG: DNA-directed DNA polymerase II small subunit [Candidatus Korarchaeota archaeon NZ13-K]|nr:MAG: DNA-directed DNA polymerase II small subunit [Candidatus Korarchaeota archaeon NZ13-K]
MGAELEVLRRALRRGINLSPEALSFLSSRGGDELDTLLDHLPDKVVLGLEDVLTLLREGEGRGIGQEELSVLLRPSDLGVSGAPEEFVRFIRFRFEKLRSMLLKRIDLEPIPIVELRTSTSRNGDNLVIVGMVLDKGMMKDRSIRMTVEDETGSIMVVFRRDSRFWEVADRVPVDSVIAIRGTYVNGKIIAESLMLPEISEEEVRPGSHEGRAALVSDVHVGSKYFNERAFNKFIRWLRSDEARDVRYLVICGDLVDGIGVYPNQEEELRIADVHKQFEYAGRILSGVPSHIKIIYAPGNHEPVRQAEPQPEVPDEYLEVLMDANPNVTPLPNPSVVGLGGVRIMLYHGRSLNAVMKHIPGLQPVTPSTVVEAMSWMLKLRNLAPIYGEHPISPEDRDWLLLEEVPNVLHTGHVHVYGVGEYKGVKLINSGTFENETPYIRSLGIEVTVGRVVVLDLKNLSVEVMDFS